MMNTPPRLNKFAHERGFNDSQITKHNSFNSRIAQNVNNQNHDQFA